MNETSRPARPCAAYYLATALSVVNLLSILAAVALTIAAALAPHVLSGVLKGAGQEDAQEDPSGALYDIDESGADIRQIRSPLRVLNTQGEDVDTDDLDLKDLDSLLRSLQGEGGQEESGSPIYNIISPRSDIGSLITPVLFVPFGMFAIMVGLFMQVILAVARGLLLAFPPTPPRRSAARAAAAGPQAGPRTH